MNFASLIHFTLFEFHVCFVVGSDVVVSRPEMPNASSTFREVTLKSRFADCALLRSCCCTFLHVSLRYNTLTSCVYLCLYTCFNQFLLPIVCYFLLYLLICVHTHSFAE